MSLSVSDRMARVKPSPTGALLARATRMRAEGIDIISLGAGEPDFDTPEFIKRAAIKAIEDGDTKYTPIDGTAALKTAISDRFRLNNGLEYAPEGILVSSGAKQSLFNLCMALLGDGNEAIIPAPYWVSYPDMVGLAGAKPVIVQAGIDQDFKITPEQLETALSDKTRLFMLNTPSNPTGACYTADELRALGKVLADYPDVVVAADDIYEHIHWADDPFTSFAAACPNLFDRTVTINGVSKAYAMTGWRIGYAAGPVHLIGAMKTVQSQSTSNPCSVSQAAAVAALSGDLSEVQDMCHAYRQRHDFVLESLNQIPGFECRPGEGTFYAFPRITGAMEALGLNSDSDFAEYLIEHGRIAAVPGSAFGAPGYLRLSFASSMEHLREALNRINQCVVA